MINVDDEDFLIATDIDKLIDILSTKKDVEVGNLSKELKMNRKEVEKWLHVLEEEGVVDLVNRMGSLYAIWVMDGAQEEPAPQRKKKATPPPKPKIEIQQMEIEDVPPAGIELASQIGAMRSVAPPLPPNGRKKSLFSDIFPRRKAKKKVSAKPSSPRLNFEDGPVSMEKTMKSSPIRKMETPEISRESLEMELSEDFEEEPALPAMQNRRPKTSEPQFPRTAIRPEPEMRMKKKLEKSEFLTLPRRQTGKLRERLEDYLQLIREGKGELRSLESEKEKIHREGFLSLEKDFEANLDSLEYALLEKEKRILEAKERFSSLPEKIGSLHDIHESISGFDTDARELLSKTKKDLDSSWGRLQEVSDELSEEISKGEDEALHDRGRMMQLRDMLASISHAEAQLKETLATSKGMLEEMEDKVRTVEESLEELADSRTVLNERIERIHSGLEDKMRGLDELRTEMEKIGKVESWFREYSEDYESKMDELQSYVAESEEELAHIKKAAELEYVKRYLNELDNSEEKYRENLGALEMEEASMDEKISEVRARIKQLMRESSELMSKYRQMTQEGAEFEEMVATAKSKSRTQRGILEEKASQRTKHLRTAPTKSRPSGNSRRTSPAKKSSSRKSASRASTSRASSPKSRKPSRKRK